MRKGSVQKTTAIYSYQTCIKIKSTFLTLIFEFEFFLSAAPNRIKGKRAENVRYEKRMVINNVLEAIGETPLVRLNYIPKMFGVKCQVCKFHNYKQH